MNRGKNWNAVCTPWHGTVTWSIPMGPLILTYQWDDGR